MIYYFEDCVFDIERRELRRGGLMETLEPQVFDLLQFLIQNRGSVVSRDDIFQAVWHGRIVSEAALSSRINAARKAIGDNGAEQRLIKTFRRKGIRFAGAVREKTTNIAAPTQIVPARPPLSLSVAGTPAIAVLPFTTHICDPRNEQFADGLTDEIIVALSKIGWLSVISRTSPFYYKGWSIEKKVLAHNLGVDYVVQGCVRLADNRVRITVQVIDVASNYHVLAERYDREAADFFGILDEIADRIAATISDQLYAAENMRAKLNSADGLSVWHYIIRALSMMNTRNRPLVSAAQQHLRKAIAIDPRSVPAYSLLSFSVTLGVHLGWHSRSRALPLALNAAQKALVLCPEEPWAHIALGYATLWNRPEEAIPNLEHALTLDPNLALAHYLIALASAYTGNCENVFSHADIAERLSARDLLTRGNAGANNNVRSTACFVTGRYHEGIEFARKTIMENPRQSPAYRALVINCALAGELEEATTKLQTLKRLAPDMSQQWIKNNAVWGRAEERQKYTEAFRMAGLT